MEVTAIMLIVSLVFGPSVAQRGAQRGTRGVSRAPVRTPNTVDQVAIAIIVLGGLLVLGFILVLASS